MIDRINDLLKRVEEFRPKAAAEVEEFRIKVLGKKGELNALMEEFKSVAPEHKREIGQRLNALKTAAQERINALKAAVAEAADLKAAAVEDMTRPGTADNIGSRHPISLVRNQIVEIFSRLGYTVAEGPEIEDDWHVFSALNFPPEHPARDMQDTFFIEKNPETVQRLTNAIVRADKWLATVTPEELVKVVPRAAFLGNPKVYVEGFVKNRPALSTDGRFPEGCAEISAAALATVDPKLKNFAFDYKTVFTNEFVDKATK